MNKKVISACLAAAAAMIMVPSIPAQASTSITSQAVKWAKETAADDSHGYSQSNRWGNPDYDCSSFVISAYKSTGLNVNGANSTSDMVSCLKKSGFTYYSASEMSLSSGSSKLKKGDILWRNGHTELYVGNGKLAGAHRDYSGGAGDPSGKEINVKAYNSSYNWSGVLRYDGDGNVSEEESEYENGYYIVDVDTFLAVRTSATASSKKIASLDDGTVVKVKDVSGTWGKITVNGQTGWISLRFCDEFPVASTEEVAKPSSTKITKVSVSDGYVKVKWKKVSKISGYKVIYKNTTESKKTKAKTVNANYKIATTEGDQYKISVKPYLTIDGKTYYGKASATKTITAE